MENCRVGRDPPDEPLQARVVFELRHRSRVASHAIFYHDGVGGVFGDFPCHRVPRTLVRRKEERNAEEAADGVNIKRRTATDGVLFYCHLNVIGVRRTRAAGIQQYALANRTRDRVVLYDGGDCIVVGDFDRRTIEASCSPNDRDAEQCGVLHRVALDVGIKDIVRTVAAREKQRSDLTIRDDANPGVVFQGVVTNCHRHVVVGAVVQPRPDRDTGAVIARDRVTEQVRCYLVAGRSKPANHGNPGDIARVLIAGDEVVLDGDVSAIVGGSPIPAKGQDARSHIVLHPVAADLGGQVVMGRHARGKGRKKS